MKAVQLSDDEIASMRAFYEKERKEALEKLQHIDGVLEKLGVPVPAGSPVAASVAPAAAPVEAAPAKPRRKRRKKPGRHSLWGNFILEVLKKHGRPLTYNDLVTEAMIRFNVPEEKLKNVQQAITNSSYRLRKINKKIQTFAISGIKGKYIGLTRWFDEDDNLKPEFERIMQTLISQRQAEKPVVKKGPKRSPGRPKGSKNKPKPAAAATAAPVVKRSPGRPKGSKNKPKPAGATAKAATAKKTTTTRKPAAAKKTTTTARKTAAKPAAGKTVSARRKTAAKK